MHGYMRICRHICIYARIYAGVHALMLTWAYICIYARIYEYRRAYMHIAAKQKIGKCVLFFYYHVSCVLDRRHGHIDQPERLS